MLTRALVAINVIAYIWQRTSNGVDTDEGLLAHGALLGTAVMAGDWWRIVTGAFLHGGEMHLLFNMIALWQVGSFVEQIFGTPRMAAIYAVSGIGSGLLVTYLDPTDVTVGASGAIFGLFGALVVAGLRLGPLGRSLLQQSIGIIVVNLIISFTFPNISKTGHIGGLLSGFVAALILFRRPAVLVAEPRAAEAVVDLHDDPGVETIEQLPDEVPRAPEHPR